MEKETDNIELFDRYIAHELDRAESEAFEQRLGADADFAADFDTYLFILKGLAQEVEQDNLDFGHAMKRLTRDELMRVVGRSAKRRTPFFRERLAWAASVAAVLLVGVVVTFNVRQAGMDRVDDIIVADNSFSLTSKSADEFTADNIPSLEQAYREAPADDVQLQKVAGMSLVMAYLKDHDRTKAKALLRELAERFADDEPFAAQCRRILDQLD